MNDIKKQAKSSIKSKKKPIFETISIKDVNLLSNLFLSTLTLKLEKLNINMISINKNIMNKF